MTLDVSRTQLSADPRSLEGLKRDAAAGDRSPQTLRAVAQQFEGVFARMLIKSMRETSFGDGLMDSEQSDFYRDMFDQQLSVELAKGRGLGLADMLMRQLSGIDGQPAAAADATTNATTATGTTTAAPAATTGDASWPPASREDFVRQVWPHAQAAAERLGVDPATIVSHAALETGWGRSLPRGADGEPSFNLFGIKAGGGWKGAAVNASTLEYSQGVATGTVQPFRAYDSIAAGLADYANVLGSNPRYAAARNTGGDVAAFASALQRGGYATDPSYATKLQAVAAQVTALLGGGDSLKTAAARPITASTRSAT